MSGRLEETYLDGLGRTQRVPRRTRSRLRRALGPPVEGGPLFVRCGESPLVGPADLIREDGTTTTVEDRLPPDTAAGYHRLLRSGDERLLVISPGVCHVPPAREWGWAVQLYASRSSSSWGIGDLADLEGLAQASRRTGAEMLLVSPLFAAAPTVPQEPSPYYPTSRRFLNPIYLRVEDVPGATGLGERLPAAVAAGQALNDDPLIDRDSVWRIKKAALDEIWSTAPPGPELEAWSSLRGAALPTFAVWCALAADHGADWRRWPRRFRHPERPAVARFRDSHQDTVRYHQWLQWLCARQLDRAGAATRLVQDLPIGFDPGGFDAWAWQDLLALDMSIGAPPDAFNPAGQDWGLPPFVPDRLRAADYAPFVETIRAGITAGGGLRIDHVLGLFRQFWIPVGARAAEGGYVRFPSSDLLDIVSLESHRAGAVVVGEDLGTVEKGVRSELARRRLLSYRLLWFEDDEPRSWPEFSMASVTTHDLPTIAGLWSGTDRTEQEELGLEVDEEAARAVQARLSEVNDITADRPVEQVVTAVHRRLAEASSILVAATLDDAALVARRPNIPGTDPGRPNWRIPLPRPWDEIIESPPARGIAGILSGSAATGHVMDEPSP